MIPKCITAVKYYGSKLGEVTSHRLLYRTVASSAGNWRRPRSPLGGVLAFRCGAFFLAGAVGAAAVAFVGFLVCRPASRRVPRPCGRAPSPVGGWPRRLLLGGRSVRPCPPRPPPAAAARPSRPCVGPPRGRFRVLGPLRAGGARHPRLGRAPGFPRGLRSPSVRRRLWAPLPCRSGWFGAGRVASVGRPPLAFPRPSPRGASPCSGRSPVAGSVISHRRANPPRLKVHVFFVGRHWLLVPAAIPYHHPAGLLVQNALRRASSERHTKQAVEP